MIWHWTRRRYAPQAATHKPRRPWLEYLEERGSPSVLPFNGLADEPLERPALPPGNVVEEERWELTTSRGDWGQTLIADARGENHPPTPTCDPAPLRLTEFPVEELLQIMTPGGPSTRDTGAPRIEDFYGREGEDGWWTFSGRVETASPGGLTILFGGLPTLEGQTTRVNDEGLFSFTIQLGNCEGGLATAQTVDWDGYPSNVAEDYVHQTRCTES